VYADSLRVRIKEVEAKLKVMGVDVPPPNYNSLPANTQSSDDDQDKDMELLSGNESEQLPEILFGSSTSPLLPLLNQPPSTALPDPTISYPNANFVKTECPYEKLPTGVLEPELSWSARSAGSADPGNMHGTPYSSVSSPSSVSYLDASSHNQNLLPGVHVEPVRRFFENAEKELEAFGPEVYKELLEVRMHVQAFWRYPNILSCRCFSTTYTTSDLTRFYILQRFSPENAP
jgi:hypothetical protein